MKTPHLYRRVLTGVLLAMAFLVIAPAVHAQKPTTTGPPVTTKNPDGTTTTTQPVEFPKTKDNGGGGMTQVAGDPPFRGKGEVRVTRSGDGDIVKVEWVSGKGRTRRAWFFKKEKGNIVVTGYDYDPQGKIVSKSERIFERYNGRFVSKEDTNVNSGGDTVSGEKVANDGGTWTKYKWDPDTGTWKNEGAADARLHEDFETWLKNAEVPLGETESSQVQQSSMGPRVQLFDTNSDEAREEYAQAMRPVSEATGRWAMRFGAMVQHSKIRFSSGSSAADFDFANDGSLEFYTGNGIPQQYANGVVMQLDMFADDNGFAARSGGNIISTMETLFGGFPVETSLVSFLSQEIVRDFGMGSVEKAYGRSAPFVEIDYSLVSCERGNVSIFSQFAFYDQQHNSGWFMGGFRGAVHNFIYPGVADVVIFDPTDFNVPPISATPPFPTPVDVVTDIETASIAALDLRQYEFTLGGRASFWQPWGNINFAFGPTITYADFDYVAVTSLLAGGAPIGFQSWEISDGCFQFGFMAQGGLSLNLTERVSLDLFFRYDWMEELEIGGARASARTNNHSIGGGGGFRFTF